MERRTLGKGLSALLGDELEVINLDEKTNSKNQIEFVPLDRLEASSFQPRHTFSEESLKDLIESIQQKGILQPLLVRKNPLKPSFYEIIAGERRFRACHSVGLSEVPVIIKNFSDKDACEVALIENLQRENLNPLEEALAYLRLMKEFNHTQEKLSKVVGKSRSHVANMVRLLDLPDKIKTDVSEGLLSMGHARALLTAKNPLEIEEKVLKRGLNVRQTEKLVQSTLENKPKKSKKKKETLKIIPNQEKTKEVISLEKELSESLETPVILSVDKDNSGDMIIHFDSFDKFNELLSLLTQK